MIAFASCSHQKSSSFSARGRVNSTNERPPTKHRHHVSLVMAPIRWRLLTFERGTVFHRANSMLHPNEVRTSYWIVMESLNVFVTFVFSYASAAPHCTTRRGMSRRTFIRSGLIKIESVYAHCLILQSGFTRKSRAAPSIGTYIFYSKLCVCGLNVLVAVRTRSLWKEQP